jgi:hypothetical protein
MVFILKLNIFKFIRSITRVLLIFPSIRVLIIYLSYKIIKDLNNLYYLNIIKKNTLYTYYNIRLIYILSISRIS